MEMSKKGWMLDHGSSIKIWAIIVLWFIKISRATDMFSDELVYEYEDIENNTQPSQEVIVDHSTHVFALYDTSDESQSAWQVMTFNFVHMKIEKSIILLRFLN